MTPASSLSLFSPAKVNLFLHIIGKRNDGYHNLQTVFRLLDWGDRLDFRLSNQSFDSHQTLQTTNLPIRLSSNVAVTEHLEDNLITKAATALITHLKTHNKLPKHPLPVVTITLTKVLPTGAGLGGGSSNAATTLLALNQLWNINLDTPTLLDIGATVGADVPIFIFGQDALAEGIGEKLTPLSLPPQHYLLLNPKAHASTQALFAHPNLCRDMPVLTASQVSDNQQRYLDCLTPPFCNVFESVVTELVPEVEEALNYLKALEKLTDSTARMTGTGSSVFLPIPIDKLDLIKYKIEQNMPPCHYVFTKSFRVSSTAHTHLL